MNRPGVRRPRESEPVGGVGEFLVAAKANKPLRRTYAACAYLLRAGNRAYVAITPSD